MKTVIATIIALTVAAPAFADVSNPQAFFALGNDSAAERIVRDTSRGDTFAAQIAGALANESAAERSVNRTASVATKADTNLLNFFALTNDSPAESRARR